MEAYMTEAVATYNSVSVFMREMEKYPVLSREEECSLAKRYREHGDLDAANRLVVSNLRFVVRTASEYKSYGFPLMDLVQEGSIGLMLAVKKFDPDKGYRFISYAVWWIRVRIQNHIMKFWSNVKIGTTQSQRRLFQKIEGAKRRLGITGRQVEDEDLNRLADHLGVRTEEISAMDARVSGRDLSLSQSVGEENSMTYEERLADSSESHEQVLSQLQFDSIVKERLDKAMQSLSSRQRKIINERFFCEPPRKLHEIAQDLGVSQERVRQIQSESVKKLGAYIKKEI